MIRMPAWRRGLLLGLLGSMASCVGAGPEPSPKRTPLPAAVCPLTPVSAARAPETLPHHEDVEFWLRDAPEEPLLSAEQIQALNAAAYRLEAGPRPLDARDVDPDRWDEQITAMAEEYFTTAFVRSAKSVAVIDACTERAPEPRRAQMRTWVTPEHD